MAGVHYLFPTTAVPSWNDQYFLPLETLDNCVTLLPGSDAQEAFDSYSMICLKPYGNYVWTAVSITKPVILMGNNATVHLNGEGPQLHIHPPGLNPNFNVNRPEDLRVTIKDVIFRGQSDDLGRLLPMTEQMVTHSAIWVDNARKVTIQGCSFQNWNGTAVWHQDDFVGPATWSTFESQNLLTNCRFKTCRMGVSTGGRSEYGLIANNIFTDCQIAFNVVGGNWHRIGNVINDTRCAYLHVKNPWYLGRVGNQNSSISSFCFNICNHTTDRSLWSTNFTLPDGTAIELGGFYFDDDTASPPTYTGNTHNYYDLKLINMVVENAAHPTRWCITGCTFMNSSIGVPESLAARVFLIGTSSNEPTVGGYVPAGNQIPLIA